MTEKLSHWEQGAVTRAILAALRSGTIDGPTERELQNALRKLDPDAAAATNPTSTP